MPSMTLKSTVGGEKKRKFVKMDLMFHGSQFIVMLMTWLVFMEIDLGYDWRERKSGVKRALFYSWMVYTW